MLLMPSVTCLKLETYINACRNEAYKNKTQKRNIRVVAPCYKKYFLF